MNSITRNRFSHAVRNQCIVLNSTESRLCGIDPEEIIQQDARIHNAMLHLFQPNPSIILHKTHSSTLHHDLPDHHRVSLYYKNFRLSFSIDNRIALSNNS